MYTERNSVCRSPTHEGDDGDAVDLSGMAKPTGGASRTEFDDSECAFTGSETLEILVGGGPCTTFPCIGGEGLALISLFDVSALEITSGLESKSCKLVELTGDDKGNSSQDLETGEGGFSLDFGL